MSEKTFSIKEVTEILDIEAYVLRYYEKELELDILRNTQGHRVYREDDIERLRHIKELREQGLELRAIKNVINNNDTEALESLAQMGATSGKPISLEARKMQKVDLTNPEDMVMVKFQGMMGNMIETAVASSVTRTFELVLSEFKNQMQAEINEEVDKIVSKKLLEIEMTSKERDEEHYRKLDEMMRDMQRKQIVETDEYIDKKKEGFWDKLFSPKRKNELIINDMEQKKSM
ncbi:MAG: MerR family transcriptional regulator [Cellulosilyticaceae bacterium]